MLNNLIKKNDNSEFSINELLSNSRVLKINDNLKKEIDQLLNNSRVLYIRGIRFRTHINKIASILGIELKNNSNIIVNSEDYSKIKDIIYIIVNWFINHNCEIVEYKNCYKFSAIVNNSRQIFEHLLIIEKKN
jgi:hypothetical protein